MITGLTGKTYDKLQLNAGVFLAGFDHSGIADAQAMKAALRAAISDESVCLGATRGGGIFQCTPSLRSIEADGARIACAGGMINDGWTVKLSAMLLETTPASFQRVFGAADVTTDGARTTVVPRFSICGEDYIPRLCWAGDTSAGFVLIELDNALNVSGAAFTFTDKGEGTLPVEFQAHMSDPQNQDAAPCRVIFISGVSAQEV